MTNCLALKLGDFSLEQPIAFTLYDDVFFFFFLKRIKRAADKMHRMIT